MNHARSLYKNPDERKSPPKVNTKGIVFTKADVQDGTKRMA